MRVGIPIISIITVIFIVVVMFISTPVVVDKYDLVELDYVVWESDETEAYDTLNPLFDAVVWIFYF